MASPRKIYWDTSCFICFLNRKELERRKICEDVLRHAQSGAILLHTSTWTIAEVVKPRAKNLPGATPLIPAQIALIEAMFRWSWVRKIDVDQKIAFRSVELSRDFGLHPADAVHAATAIIWGLDTLQKWDRDFSRVAHLINVEEPSMLTTPQQQAEMFDPARIGPHPDDFEEPSGEPEDPKA